MTQQTMASGIRTLAFDRLVDRRLVHRLANSEVLLTDLAELQRGRWQAGIQVDRGHPQIGGDRTLPETLALEAMRQVGIAIGHLGYKAPMNSAFTMQEAWLEWPAGKRPVVPRNRPLDVTAWISVVDEIWRRNSATGLALEARFTDGDAVLWRAGGSLRVITEHQYRAIRRHAPSPKAVPERHDPAIILASDPTGCPCLGYDISDPFFFDHVPDHVPGMLLVNAMTTLHRATDPRRPLHSLKLTCQRFAEYSPAVQISWDSTGSPERIEFFQNGHTTATGSVD